MRSRFLFYGLLLYTIIYYSQLGSRIPALGKIRIEFFVGLIILLIGTPQFIKKITHNEEEKKILYPIYFFFAAAVISIPTTVAGYYTINWLIYLLKSFAIFIMIYAGVNTEKELKAFIYILLIMAGVVIVEAFFLSLSGRGFLVYGSGFRRLEAVTRLFGSPNALGGFSAGTFPLIYFLFKYEKLWVKKLTLVAFGLITLRVIALTQSRSAFVGIMSFIFFLWITSKNKVLAAIVIFISLLVGWSSLDTITKDRYLTMLDADDVVLGQTIFNETGEEIRRGSMAKRYEIILDGLRLFLQRPLTGFGIGSYQVARIERLGRWQEAHNAYVQCLAELGIVGFLPWCLILINTFKLLGRTRKIAIEREQIGHPMFIYQMIYAFHGYLVVHFTLSMFGHNPYQNYWWIPAAVSLILIKILKEKDGKGPHGDL